MISVSVVTVFHLASRGNGRSHNYFITYYLKCLRFGGTIIFYSYEKFTYSSTASLFVIKIPELSCLVEVVNLLSTS